MWTNPVTLTALIAAVTGLLTSVAALVTAIKGHAKANNAVNDVAELRIENGNGHK